MITLDLKEQRPTIEELLRFAASDSVLIRDEDGREFVLESADEFDREVATLGQSERFRAFLAERAKEPGTVSLEEVEQRLQAGDDQMTTDPDPSKGGERNRPSAG
jgi:hypothetical protein